MSELELADYVTAEPKTGPAYVPPLQLTAGQPPPIAANGGLSYMSFDQNGDAGTAEALFDKIVDVNFKGPFRLSVLVGGSTTPVRAVRPRAATACSVIRILGWSRTATWRPRLLAPTPGRIALVRTGLVRSPV